MFFTHEDKMKLYSELVPFIIKIVNNLGGKNDR